MNEFEADGCNCEGQPFVENVTMLGDTPPPAATTTQPTVTSAETTAPPQTTNWTLVVVSGVMVSVVTSLFWMSVQHAHRAIKKENRRQRSA